jgi:hypothetical protein
MLNIQNGGRMQSGCQFEFVVVLYSKLDSNSAILNWIGSPPSHARLLGSPAPSWCSICPPWSSPWFLRIIKSLDSNRLSILSVENKNKFTWWFNCCAHDRVIRPSISTEGIIVAKVLMSSSTCLRCRSLGLKLGPSDVAIALSYPACRLFFFAFGAYVMYISIFLHIGARGLKPYTTWNGLTFIVEWTDLL